MDGELIVQTVFKSLCSRAEDNFTNPPPVYRGNTCVQVHTFLGNACSKITQTCALYIVLANDTWKMSRIYKLKKEDLRALPHRIKASVSCIESGNNKNNIVNRNSIFM